MAKHWNIAESELVDDNGDPVALMPSLVGLTKQQAIALVVADGYLIKPDLSAVSGIPERYWKVVSNALVEMTQPEKDAVDAAIAAGEVADDKSGAVSNIENRRELKAIVKLLVQLINIERAEHGRGAITENAFRQQLIDEVNNG